MSNKTFFIGEQVRLRALEPEDLEKALPEVDLFIKIDEYDTMWRKIEKLIKDLAEYPHVLEVWSE